MSATPFLPSHRISTIFSFINAILATPRNVPGCLVEAGCFKGSSTAKFSLAARAAGRKLVVFDSFEGIPPHDEAHSTNIFGKPVSFPSGSYCGQLDEVESNVARLRVKSAGWSKGGLMRQCRSSANQLSLRISMWISCPRLARASSISTLCSCQVESCSRRMATFHSSWNC